jgi:hypothetical protein
VKQKTSHDAFEWFVLNDSGGLTQTANWPLWDAWRHTPGNSAKYIQVLDFLDELRTLPPPDSVSSEELIADAAQEDVSGSPPH